MNDHTLHVLEYHSLLDLLASYAASDPGRAWILACRPAKTKQQARQHRDLFEAFLGVRHVGQTLPAADFDSPSDALKRVAPKGSVLEAEDFLSLRRFIRITRDIRQILTGEAGRTFSAIAALGGKLSDFSELYKILQRTFDDQGRVQDNATPELQRIRSRRRQLERQINHQLEGLLNQNDLDDVFNDRYVAQRNDRYVIPVPRDYKSRVKGVVHDQSNSGQTLFMEPELTLEQGNELASLRFEERDEILRILASLSDFVRGCRNEIQRCDDALVLYDAAFAISAWGKAYECHFPAFGDRLELRDAHHPLLAHQLHRENRKDDLVPLDIELDPTTRVVAITGSNTGGKTVTLKTVGLLTLALQSGFPIPASPKSVLPFRPAVLADIGDEQSIEQSLSTFSGHLKNIAAILQEARQTEALVLIDELGSGTDPIEGGALGCAILDTLCESKALTLVTTHMGIIKNFVHNRERMINASVRFNAETLQPEYVLDVGRPGASHALTIAGRLGMPGDVLQRARNLVDSDAMNLEDLLSSLEEKERQVSDDLDTARDAREVAVREREELNSELSELRNERKKMLHEAQQEAANIVANTRREMENLLQKARQAGKGQEAKSLRKSIQRKHQKLAKSAEQTAPTPPKRFKRDDLETGMRVWLPVLNEHARIESLTDDKKRATVEVDGKRFELKTSQVMPPKEEAEEEQEREVRIHKPAGSRQVKSELNLIGLRVEQALPKLERYLDEALLAGLPQVRIIHGFGTGQLRKGIHEHLDGNPAVLDYKVGMAERDPGGGGATMVKLS